MKRNLSGRIFICVLSLVMLIEQTGIVAAKPYSSLANLDLPELSLVSIEQSSETEIDILPISPEEDNLPSSSSESSDEENSDNRKINPGISLSSTKLAQHEAEKVILEVNTFPKFIPTLGSVKLEWQVIGLDVIVPNAYTILINLPSGLKPAGDFKYVFDEKSSTIEIPLSTLSGQVEIQSDGTQMGHYELLVRLMMGAEEITSNKYILEQADNISIDKTGGSVSGFSNQITVTFPKDAFTNATYVWVKPISPERLPSRLPSNQVFEVLAQDKASEKIVHQFSQPLELAVQYNESALPFPEESLVLYTYDEKEDFWVPIESWVDSDANILYGRSNHLSFFGSGENSFDAARPPFIESIQTGGFTGSTTYSYPLQLPAGPAGLQPNLTLSYNSQVVDESTSHTQASWVGMGWSLDAGRITRNIHGTPDDLGDDTYSISLSGVNGTLLLGTDGYYHTSAESFWRIKLNADNTWTVWDKTGNEYTFTPQGVYPRRSCTNPPAVTWVWGLSKVKNIYQGDVNNYIQYNYAVESKYGGAFVCDGQSNKTMNTAVYLDTIVYPHRRYRISFIRNSRTDYFNGWDYYGDYRVLFEKSYLSEIRVEHDADGNGSYEELIRKYVLTYESNASNRIFPGIVWPDSSSTPAKALYQGMLTLTQIREYGSDSTSLPATQFFYENKMHLTSVENGYGGKVTFQYELWYERAGSSNEVFEDLGVYPASCDGNTSSSWFKVYGPENSVYCSGLALQIANSATAGKNTNYDNPFTHPGGVYRVVADYAFQGGGNAIRWDYGIKPGKSKTRCTRHGKMGGPISKGISPCRLISPK